MEQFGGEKETGRRLALLLAIRRVWVAVVVYGLLGAWTVIDTNAAYAAGCCACNDCNACVDNPTGNSQCQAFCNSLCGGSNGGNWHGGTGSTCASTCEGDFIPETSTPTATATMTSTLTATPVPPTATATSTFTAVPPTATATSTHTHTATAVPPTATPTHTATAVPPTSTATHTATAVPATSTPTHTATEIPPTATATHTATEVPPTATATATHTATAIPPTSTATHTETAVPATSTATHTATEVPPTSTPTHTPTDVPATSTSTATATWTGTATPSRTFTPTATPTTWALCPAVPMSGCHVNAKSKLILKDKEQDAKDLVGWRWKSGDLTDKSQFGDPVMGGTAYAFCLYDEVNGSAQLVLEAKAPSAGICDGRDCWRGTRTGYRYGDTDLTPDGLKIIKLRAANPARAKAIVKGRGLNLQMPTLPLAGTRVTAQLINTEGECWSAEFTEPKKNKKNAFKAKNY